jgi:hypothetical protein
MIAAALVCGGLVTVPVSAQAADNATTPVATASASVGGLDIVVNGQASHLDPTAPCESSGTLENVSGNIDAGAVRYGRGTTTCAKNADGTASAKATGQRFETTVLQQFGGPVIKIRTYSTSCATKENGSSGNMELSGLTGVTVPDDIPANYTVTVPSPKASDPPLANVVFNELVAPSPPDGSLKTHTMRIVLFPQGGPASGEIVVGTASCDPFGG